MNHSKLKILWIVPWYPNRFDNYEGDFICRQAWAAQLFDDITVLAIIPQSINDYEIMVQKNKLTEILVFFPDTTNPIVKSFRTLRALFLGYKTILDVKRQNSKFDLIHANIIGAASVLAFLLSLYLKIPFIISEHWTGPLTMRQQTAYKFARRISRKAKALIVLTQHMENLMRARGFKNKFYKVPNVVDIEMFAPKIKSESKTLRLLHVSSLRDDIKNVSGILQAFAKLKNENVRLDIIGGGGDDIKLKKLAQDLGILNKKVFFAGIQPHNKIAEAMSGSDVFIMNSRRESFSCVIMEAMSCGLPIISTNVVGIVDYIDETVGILINSDDTIALEKAISEMIYQHKKFSPEKIRQKIAQSCSYEKVGSMIHDIYSQVKNSK